LSLGLNVVAGWAGLLDLGYVAFYGVGAYAYALLASDQFGVHLPTVLAVPAAVLGCALVGLLVGLTSWRLLGDYLSVATLFFGQLFITFVTNGDRITFPGTHGLTDLTGGPNGIA